jgi:hypothetical protein
LNSALLGDQIIGVFDPDNHCVGINSNTSGPFDARLEGCPDDYGNNGGWATIDVLGYSRANAGYNFFFMANLHFSDLNYGGGCYGSGCIAVIGATSKGGQVNLGVGDGQIQNGHPDLALGTNIWAEL